MRKFILLSLILVLGASPAAAQSCYDLWYARNLIFAQNGYCFSTSLGRRVFGSYPCWTRNPTLNPAERAQVEAIRAREYALGCKVNN